MISEEAYRCSADRLLDFMTEEYDESGVSICPKRSFPLYLILNIRTMVDLSVKPR